MHFFMRVRSCVCIYEHSSLCIYARERCARINVMTEVHKLRYIGYVTAVKKKCSFCEMYKLSYDFPIRLYLSCKR